jgi:hypothetical protein
MCDRTSNACAIQQEDISGGHDRRSAGVLDVDFDSICRKTADLYRLQIDARRDHPFVAVGCVGLGSVHHHTLMTLRFVTNLFLAFNIHSLPPTPSHVHRRCRAALIARRLHCAPPSLRASLTLYTRHARRLSRTILTVCAPRCSRRRPHHPARVVRPYHP